MKYAIMCKMWDKKKKAYRYELMNYDSQVITWLSYEKAEAEAELWNIESKGKNYTVVEISGEKGQRNG